MKFSDFLSVAAIVVSLLTTVLVLKSQQNFDVEVKEVEELKDVRSELITLVASKAHCLPTSDLQNLGNNDCSSFSKVDNPNLLNLATQIRWLIYKKKYLFEQQDLVRLKMTGETEPLADVGSQDYELDGEEFLDFLKTTILVVDERLQTRRRSFGKFY